MTELRQKQLRIQSSIRSFVSHPISFFLTLYVMSLTCSVAAMEITAWVTAVFCVLYVLLDGLSDKKQSEMHTLGVELPILAFIVIVIIGLRRNAPQGDFLSAIGNLRSFLLIYILAFSLQVYKNLNRLFSVLLFCAVAVCAYGVWQHFTGIDLWRHDNLALKEIATSPGLYASVGFFDSPEAFGHTFMMILCLPWAALLLARRLAWWQIATQVIAMAVIVTALTFSYGRGVWLAVIVALPIMAFFASRKLFIVTLTLLALTAGVLYKTAPQIKDQLIANLTDTATSTEERRKSWDANMEMFHDHPWVGVGLRQNEPLSDEYYKKLNITEGMRSHAHSNYVEFLSTTGLLGFTAYMLFILAFILMTARLFSTIPSTHYWHRVFALAALGAQISFHVGGLTQWNWGDTGVQYQFVFWLAIIAYMSHHYYAHIVPDDHSL